MAKKVIRFKPAGKEEAPKDGLMHSAKVGRPFMVVGVGASAGGMEAFQTLLRKLPSDIQTAFIFVCHLSPDHKSTLDEIFQRETKLRVQVVNESVAVEPGHIYVLPPDRQMRLVGGVLRPEPRKKSDGQYRPIDLLFQTLAIDQGNYAVGIILSGNGNDGIAGLEQIKAEGGVTFAQTEASAAFPMLPGAAQATNCVDFVLPPEQIATELKRISRHPVLMRGRTQKSDETTGPESDLQKVFALLRALNGVDFSYYKHSTLKRRILRRMFLLKVEHLPDYIRYLQKNPSEVDLLFNDLLINVTSFFRDPHVFAALRKKVFPRFIKKSRSEPIRVWIPGCSTGEEVYSMAICLFEFLGKNPQGRSIQIFATDISEVALSKARSGLYPETIATVLSPERLRRFFTKVDGGYQIAKFIRDSCVFARQNLIEDPPFSKLDLISCRNVLIYLGPLLQKKVIPIFHYALRPGGHLLLGGSETIGLFADLFDLTDKKNKIYSKRDAAPRPDMEFIPKAMAAEAPAPPPIPPLRDETPTTLDLARQVDRLLLAQYAPSGIVINSRMEVLQFRGQTGAFVEHSPGDASLNLLKMLKPELLVDVRTALSRAIKVDATIRKEHIHFQHQGRSRDLTLEVIPIKNPTSSERFFLLVFAEAPADEALKADGSRKLPVAQNEQVKREVSRLREELSSTKESLQAIIEEQEATNEELKSANEEIQSSNEELQSTNEELETAKEELQSTNEELTTLNEELQNRNVELSQLNNDLRNLLSSVSMPILMLGNDLTVRRFTPLAERFFNLIPTDVGRRISDINPNIIVPKLSEIVSEVIESLKIQEHEVQDREGRWYSMRVRPYRTTENKIDGAVLLLVDIDEIKRGLDEFMMLVHQPLLTLRGDLRVNHANDAFYKTFATTRKQTEEVLIYDLCNGAWNCPALKNLLEGILPEKQRVENYKLEHDFGPLGKRSLLVSARRLVQRSKGTQLTLLAINDVTDQDL